jgi:hypothetical protein
MCEKTVGEYSLLSLPARVAVALHCFEGYCRAKGLRHYLIDTFLNHMWELPVIASFPEWESRNGDLVDAGLGDPFPQEIVTLLRSVGASEEEFRRLVQSTVEIIYSSAYAASDNAGSLRFLGEVLHIASGLGVAPPPAQPFLMSLFADNYGWGMRISREQRDAWRHKAYD